MSFRRALAHLLLALAGALGLIAGPPLAGPASAVEVLVDGGFEATVPNTTTNPYWEGFDSEYPQGPLCRTDNYCSNGDFGKARRGPASAGCGSGTPRSPGRPDGRVRP